MVGIRYSNQLEERRTYYVVTFPNIYSYENNRVVIKIPNSRYYTLLLAQYHNINRHRGMGLPEAFHHMAISPSICLETSISGKQEALMYLIYLESRGMPVEYNKFAFPYEIIFENLDAAIDYSHNLQLTYTEEFRQKILQSTSREIEERRKEIAREIFNEVITVGLEIAKETIEDVIKDIIKELITEGKVSFDPASWISAVGKATLKVLFKKMIAR